MKMTKYAIEIFYSEEDKGYIATAPELSGCSAYGQTEEQALEELKVAMELWLSAAQSEGRVIPPPQGKELLRQFSSPVFRKGALTNLILMWRN